jgi:hypothetical protein
MSSFNALEHVDAATIALRKVNLADLGELQTIQDSCRELLSAIRIVLGKVERACNLSPTEERDERKKTEILLPIIDIALANNGKLVARADWNPPWREEVEEAIAKVNATLQEGKYGFVDSNGQVHTLQESKVPNEAFIRAVAESLARKLKNYALPLLETSALDT